MKKFLAKIFVIAALLIGAAFAFPSCSSKTPDAPPLYPEQPSDNGGNDKNGETKDKNDDTNGDNNGNNGGGIWTPPVKEN